MSIEVNIDSEAVNKAVTEALVGSILGEQLTKEINELLKPGYSRENMIKTIVNARVHAELTELLSSEEYQKMIRDALVSHIDKEFLDQMTHAAVQKATAALRGY